MGTPNNLYALQQTDTKLLAFRAELNKTQQALKEPDDLVSARKKDVELSTSLTTLATSIKDSELQIGTLQAKLNRSTERLYSGKIKNPKELEDIENEVKSLNNRKETMELELMELMENQESISETSKANKANLTQMEEGWVKKSQSLRIEQGEIALKMKALLGKRKEQAAKIDLPILTQYQKLVQSKSGLGLVTLKGRNCSGCKIGMDGGTVRLINSGKLANCPSCGRYLIRE
ncbi:MAG: zinc ribbon domain-containing protein [Anaerolineae bacterium]